MKLRKKKSIEDKFLKKENVFFYKHNAKLNSYVYGSFRVFFEDYLDYIKDNDFLRKEKNQKLFFEINEKLLDSIERVEYNHIRFDLLKFIPKIMQTNKTIFENKENIIAFLSLLGEHKLKKDENIKKLKNFFAELTKANEEQKKKINFIIDTICNLNKKTIRYNVSTLHYLLELAVIDNKIDEHINKINDLIQIEEKILHSKVSGRKKKKLKYNQLKDTQELLMINEIVWKYFIKIRSKNR